MKLEMICLHPNSYSLSKGMNTSLFIMLCLESSLLLCELVCQSISILLCLIHLQRHTNKQFHPLNIIRAFLFVLLLCFIAFTMWYFLIQTFWNRVSFTVQRQKGNATTFPLIFSCYVINTDVFAVTIYWQCVL